MHLFQINHLVKISTKNHVFLKTYNSEFQTLKYGSQIKVVKHYK